SSRSPSTSAVVTCWKSTPTTRRSPRSAATRCAGRRARSCRSWSSGCGRGCSGLRYGVPNPFSACTRPRPSKLTLRPSAQYHVVQPPRRLGLGARGALRAALLAPPGARERERLRACDLDLGLAVVLPDGPVHEDVLALVAALELGGRQRVEAPRLDDGGEAVERGLEGEQAGDRRAVHVHHAALDGRLLADVLVGLLPCDRPLRGGERREGDEERDRERAQA